MTEKLNQNEIPTTVNRLDAQFDSCGLWKNIDVANNIVQLLPSKSFMLLIVMLMSTLTVSAQPWGSVGLAPHELTGDIKEGEFEEIELRQKKSIREISLDENVDNSPNSRFITVHRDIMDTIRAKAMFSEIKPKLLLPLEKGQEKQTKCESLLVSKAKKVKDPKEINLLEEAYRFSVTTHPECKKESTPIWATMFIPGIGPALTGAINSVRDEQRDKYYNKDVKKGKLTDDVRTYLKYYNDYLVDSIQKVKDDIEVNWLNCLPEIPKKNIIERIQNPLYRGCFYNSRDTLDLLEVYQQRKGWEFLYTGSKMMKYESYPNHVEYYVYDVAPNYKVRYFDGVYEVYDMLGNLVYVSELTRNQDREFEYIQRRVFLRDYNNNKYNIKSESQSTQYSLKLYLGENWSGQVMDLHDYDANDYFCQLRRDHEDEFYAVYMIERLSNLSFRLVFLNTKLEPSYCAILTYETNSPFSSTFRAILVEIPDNIPPVVKN